MCDGTGTVTERLIRKGKRNGCGSARETGMHRKKRERMQPVHGNGRKLAKTMRILHGQAPCCEATIHKTLVLRIVYMTNFHNGLWTSRTEAQPVRLCINERIKMAQNVYYSMDPEQPDA